MDSNQWIDYFGKGVYLMKFEEFIRPCKSGPYYKRLADICDSHQYEFKDIGFNLRAVIVNPKAKETLVIVAGIHGDEIAGPLALLEFFDRDKVLDEMRIVSIPLANVTGFNKKTREGRSRRNINRLFGDTQPSHEAGAICNFLSDIKADFFLSLHEDDTADGFSLYYQDESLKPMCLEILAIAKQHMPLDSRKNIHGDEVERRGLIFVTEKRAKKAPPHKNSLEGWMFRRGVKYICTETSAKLPLQKRVACQYDIVKWFVDKQ